MRLDKFISHYSDYSRSDVKKLIKAQRVTLNSELATQANTAVSLDHDTIEVDGERIEVQQAVYLMLNKPQGVVCANTDSEHPTVIDVLRSSTSNTNERPLPFDTLQIAGRLDIDTTGLVFITTDGKWNQRVTSPSQRAKKTYRVSLAEPLAADAVEQITQGILLKGETKPTRPAEIKCLTDRTVQLSIAEGKYHQVKRMFAAVGNHVSALHRENIAGVNLDSKLAPGEFRHLTFEELELITVNTGRHEF